MRYTYLDWAASAPPDPEMLEVYVDTARRFCGNPSSIHSVGIEARDRLEEARNRCAEELQVPADTLIFTSGGSEGNNAILLSQLNKVGNGSVIVSGIEHPSGYLPAKQLENFGYTVRYAAPNRVGIVTPDCIARLIDKDTRLVSVMTVNNETGLCQPISEIAAVVREARKGGGKPIHLHTDAVQALGKIAIDFTQWDVDSAVFSAHKIGGPRGIGLLYSRKPFPTLIRGGGQEHGLRPGTENVAGAAAFARLFNHTIRDPQNEHVDKLDRLLSEGLRHIPEALLIPEDLKDQPGHRSFSATRSPYIRCVLLPPVPGEVLVRVMDRQGFLVSTGSACSSRRKDRNRILHSMGVAPESAFCSIRVSLGRSTTEDEVDNFCSTLAQEYAVLKETLSRQRQ